MTTLTVSTFLIIVYGMLNRRGYGVALALGGATPIGAALVFGDTAVPTFYAVALGVPVGLAVRLLLRTRAEDRTPRPPIPGFVPLVLFVVWSILVTLVSRQVFSDVTVLAPGGIEQKLFAGAPTNSNIAQLTYLLLGLAIVVFLARAKRAGPELIGLAVGLTMLLSLWAYLNQNFGLPFPEGLFDNSPTFVFIDTAPGGATRFRGIFSEPSGLAISSLVTIAYMARRAPQVKGLHRVGVIVMMLIAAFLASISTSGTFVVASVVLVFVAALAFFGTFLFRRGPLSPLAVTIACAGVIASFWFLPLVAALVEGVVSDKVDSSSFSERSGADALSYQLLFQTYGIGVGLGSHRPSSFLAGLFSTVGIIGTVLFIITVFILIRRSYAVLEYRPVVWGLIALLITKVVASPDLADPSGILWMSLGLLAHAAVSRSSPVATVGKEFPVLVR